MSYFCLLLSFRLNAISLASLNVNVKIEIFVLVAGFIFKEWNAGCTIRMVGRLRSLSLEFLILASMAHVAVFAAKKEHKCTVQAGLAFIRIELHSPFCPGYIVVMG